MANTTCDPIKGGFFTGASDALDTLIAYGEQIAENKVATKQMLYEAKREVRDIDGIKYIWSEPRNQWELFEKQIPSDDPVPGRLTFFTMDGLIAYINENPEGLIDENNKAIVHVVNEMCVILLSAPSKFNKARHEIARTEAHVPKIRFGEFLDTERFNTMLLSTFHQTEARDSVFALVKSMTKKQTAQTTDDGVSQQITVMEGVATASNVQFKNPVPLKPMRTFTEIDQPESNFTLRVNQEAEVALHESDGGAWKNEAVARIADYLAVHINSPWVTILA